jgi:hypothetical protein
MIILGSKDIPSELIYYITTKDEIEHTKPNSILMFDYNIELMKYCLENSLSYAVKVSSIKEAIFANNLGAKYILPIFDIVQTIQQIAQNYMFDAKILATIEDENKIERFALQNIDGVLIL